MKLFYTKRSPYARKVRVVAQEKILPLELAEEDLACKSDDLLNSNPVGKIPVLVLDDGRIFSDSSLICEYLDSLNDEPALIPRVSPERFKILNLAAVANGLMDVTVALYLEKSRHKDNASKAFIDGQEQAILRCLRFFEKHIEELFPLSVASIATACAAGYIEFRLPHLSPAPDRHPELSAWLEEFSQRSSIILTLPVP